MKKIILIVIDGLGDKPIPQLKNRTPLEAANTPNLDWLANKGICGLVEPYLMNEKPESDTCHLALFGYDPKIYYLGRGPYEAAGLQPALKLEEGDLYLRVNFATLDKNLKVIDRRAGRIEKTQPLINALKGIEIRGVKFLIKKSYGHRAVLILRNRNLSAKISDSDPKKEGLKIKNILPLDKSPEAIFTADILNKFLFQAHQILQNHPLNKNREKKELLPANCLLTRGAGFFKETPSFEKKYGLKTCCIAGGALYKGIAKILGMDLIKVEGATGLANTNLKGKIEAVKNALKKYNFVFLHIKAADSLAEDGNFQGKKEFIEKIDKNLKPMLNLKNTLIVVTADHSTCSDLKRHCQEPVPLLIWGDGQDSVKEFSEKACKKGKLGKIKQLNLMAIILSLV
ncbi:MAG: 2,3-bisphosphoglycerate-independent phosphoglycerate mutase [Patescibacteria group bacterium]|nr:2,3-bisphosphoglycerate-independent phosphoglycerate mutase [Patescibacteria group bacterium]